MLIKSVQKDQLDETDLPQEISRSMMLETSADCRRVGHTLDHLYLKNLNSFGVIDSNMTVSLSIV